MNEKTRIALKGIVFALLALTLLLFSATLLLKGNWLAGAPIVLIALVIALFGAKFVKGRYELMKNKIPQEDERTDRIMKKAGYYAFLANIWVLLGLMWYAGTGVEEYGYPEILPRHVAAAGILASAVIFGVLYVYFGRKGDFE
jgi:hypothetical protein